MPTESNRRQIQERLAIVRATIGAAEKRAGRPAGSVHLIAVSKTVDVDGLEAAIEAGQREFGENRVQEAQAKWPALKARFPALRLHLIGPLQSNKLKDALALFDAIETVDREKIAAALSAGLGGGDREFPLF